MPKDYGQKTREHKNPTYDQNYINNENPRSVNSHTSNISKRVDYHLQPIFKEIPSYVKDTKDFNRKLVQMEEVTEDSLLVTVDLKSSYTNIPNNEGIKPVKMLIISTLIKLF